MRAEVVRCDGCGLEADKPETAAMPLGWRRVRVTWPRPSRTDLGRYTQSKDFDVCPDSMCAARVVDLTRPYPPLSMPDEAVAR